MYLVKDFYFEAAHHLNDYKGKCKNVHGHSYKLQLTIYGKPANNGMVMDFGDLKKIVENKVICSLDHANLNDIISQPTVENLCQYIWDKLKNELSLYEVKIWETRDSSAFIRVNDES